MSRSYRKNDYIGIGGCSEKYDKRLANRALRHSVKTKLLINLEQILPVMREVSDVWSMNKDGKTYFGDFLTSNSRFFPNESKSEDEYYKKIYRKMKNK